MGKVKDYFKWLFTRWYLYVIALLLSLNTFMRSGYDPLGFAIGVIIGAFVQSIVIISVIYGIYRLVKRLFKKKG